MLIEFEDRLSDSPLVERVWRSRSCGAGRFVSVAATNFEMVVSRVAEKTFLTMRGPETRASEAECPAEGEWVGIRFRLETFMPKLTPGEIRDRRDATMPGATGRSFWLEGSAWEYPGFENAESFVCRLLRKGMLARDGAVDAVLHGQAGAGSLRSVQRHFARATGLSWSAARQIERARRAAVMLRDGISILDTVFEAGYYDQAHLARAMKFRMGQTPREIAEGRAQLSFLYKTNCQL